MIGIDHNFQRKTLISKVIIIPVIALNCPSNTECADTETQALTRATSRYQEPFLSLLPSSGNVVNACARSLSGISLSGKQQQRKD